MEEVSSVTEKDDERKSVCDAECGICVRRRGSRYRGREKMCVKG